MLTGGHRGNVGGAQLQQVLIGRELASRGHDVCFIEWDTENKESGYVDGIEIKLIPRLESLPSALQALGRVSTTLKVLKQYKPDVCYVRTQGFVLFPTFLYTKFSNSSLVYGFAHDSELTSNPTVLRGSRLDSKLFKKAFQLVFEHSSALISQNEYQFSESKKRFSTRVFKIPNGYPEPQVKTVPEVIDNSDKPTILWIATLRPWKQPNLVLQLAEEHPGAQFVIAGGKANEAPELYTSIREKAEKIDNVEFVGFVPYDKTDSYFHGADIFLNTSESEGFPNTFLQAWATKTPVATLNVDPDGIVSSNSMGVTGDGSMTTLSNRVGSLVNDSEVREQMGENAHAYYLDNHSITAVVDRYESAFSKCV